MASDNQIMVFGYGSKLFRDDIAAEYCDNNKQLHPHELDHMTTIDRYESYLSIMTGSGTRWLTGSIV